MPLLLFLILFLHIHGNRAITSEILHLSDEKYYEMPDFLYLDNYEKCLSQKDGVYCVGTFTILDQNSMLYNTIKKFSENSKSNLNHTKLYRGLCLSSGNYGSCTFNDSINLSESFETCMNSYLNKKFNLRARLTILDYCKNNQDNRKLDILDYIFICFVILIVSLNMFGTIFHVFNKGNHWLLCFSLTANWKILTDNDTKDKKFKSLDGLRAILALLVILPHTSMALLNLPANPRFFEQTWEKPYMIILNNGNLLVTIFIIISTFLRANKILEDAEKSKPVMKIVFKALIDRIVRISPLYVSILAYSATLAAYTSDGPLWRKYIEGEADECRETFWRHLIFVQNFFQLGKCLPQVWYLSTDIQLYVVSTVIMVILVQKKQKQIQKLFLLFIISLIVLGVINHYLKLKSSLMISTPEFIRNLFAEDRSFVLLYQSLWGNLPSAIIGLLAGVIYYKTKKCDLQLNCYKTFTVLCRISVPLALFYITLGYVVLHTFSSPFLITLYSTVDKAGFAIISVFIIFGCLIHQNVIHRSFLEWQGWKVLSRLSLSSLLLHCVINKSIVGSRIHPSTVSNMSIISDWLATAVLTFLISVPVSLMIEYPSIQLYNRARKISKDANSFNMSARNKSPITNVESENSANKDKDD